MTSRFRLATTCWAPTDLNGQRLATEQINDGQGTEARAVGQLIGHEVQSPDRIGSIGLEALPAIDDHLAPLGQLRAQLQLLLAVEPVHLVSAQLPAFALQQHVNATVAIAHARARDLAHPRP
jgi:hypothetical protein